MEKMFSLPALFQVLKKIEGKSLVFWTDGPEKCVWKMKEQVKGLKLQSIYKKNLTWTALRALSAMMMPPEGSRQPIASSPNLFTKEEPLILFTFKSEICCKKIWSAWQILIDDIISELNNASNKTKKLCTTRLRDKVYVFYGSNICWV